MVTANIKQQREGIIKANRKLSDVWGIWGELNALRVTVTRAMPQVKIAQIYKAR